MTTSTTSTTSTRLPVSPRQFFALVSIAEAVTWTLLITGMVLKYGLHLDTAVLIGGSIHGLVLVTVFILVVLAIVTTLLIIGPPGGRK